MCFHPFPPFSFSVGEWKRMAWRMGSFFSSFIFPAFSLCIVGCNITGRVPLFCLRGSFDSRTFDYLSSFPFAFFLLSVFFFFFGFGSFARTKNSLNVCIIVGLLGWMFSLMHASLGTALICPWDCCRMHWSSSLSHGEWEFSWNSVVVCCKVLGSGYRVQGFGLRFIF